MSLLSVRPAGWVGNVIQADISQWHRLGTLFLVWTLLAAESSVPLPHLVHLVHRRQEVVTNTVGYDLGSPTRCACHMRKVHDRCCPWCWSRTSEEKHIQSHITWCKLSIFISRPIAPISCITLYTIFYKFPKNQIFVGLTSTTAHSFLAEDE